ncbi:cysteine desulfurase [Shewanella maritima]|uniref:Cysteine desulfurase n=1 Tax=Shewanella maritima TaxID=2520507 RepID=A0A411PJK4_9GAMM|nr:cysteine desulfurase [Shewanella maritima]QBF83739.1 cysteine desulfurase [Shewanella maritima]
MTSANQSTSTHLQPASTEFDHNAVRAQFPLLTLGNTQQDGDSDGDNSGQGEQQVCYLDTAATSQKPQCVIDAMTAYYQRSNANVHRAAHQLSAAATRDYEAVREQVASFINAASSREIIFTQGTTSAINMLSYGLTEQFAKGDVILVDGAAHHANIVPWQELAKRTGAIVKPIPLTNNGLICQQGYQTLLVQKPKLVALAHVTNALGTINPVADMLAQAQQAGAMTFVDGAQAVAHLTVDVSALNCDFYAFSGHKMYGPTGIGVLYGKFEQLDKLTPMLTGGEMIKTVSFSGTTFGELPNRLEAGTPAIAEVIGLGAAIEFLNSLDKTHVSNHERGLMSYLQQQLSLLEDINLYGLDDSSEDGSCGTQSVQPQSTNVGALAFNIKGEHHQDVGILLDQQNIAVRCGHHCAMPLMEHLALAGCCRVSIGVYSNKADIDRFINGLKEVIDILV